MRDRRSGAPGARVADMPLPASPKYGTVPYGDRTFGDLFTPRQLVAITTFSDLIGEARERVRDDAGNDDAAAVALYLACARDSIMVRSSRSCSWGTALGKARRVFSRQALPMVWDYAEANPLGGAEGAYGVSIDTVTQAIRKILTAQGPR